MLTFGTLERPEISRYNRESKGRTNVHVCQQIIIVLFLSIVI